jgi:hypothetical protein
MEAILSQRFSPFNFSIVPGFPNVFPTIDEWGICLPIFREHRDDNLTENFHEFHEIMHQWEIHHQDVLLNIFMFSLARDAHEWYHSFPPTSVSSLEQFHAAFNTHSQRYYSCKLIYHKYCEEYRDGVWDIVRSCERCEDEGHPPKEMI